MSRTEELIALAQQGDKAAYDALVSENAGLIWSVTRRFLGRGTESDDLYQLGCLGFLKAVEGFDLEYGTQFSTYAVPKIAGEIRRFLRDDGAVKVSRTIKEQAATIKIARNKLNHTLEREPTINELAELTGWRKRTLVNTALDREAQESTYLGYGLAIPHARVFGLTQPAVYLARSTPGVDWQGSAARLVFLVVVPEEYPEWHLQLLSRIVRWRQKSGLTEDEMVSMPAEELAASLRELLVL